MIKDVIDLINEKIYVISYTNRSIHLSNGNTWRSYKFRQAETYLNKFIQIESAKDPEVHVILNRIEEIKKSIKDRHQKRLDIYEAVLDEIKEELKSINLIDVLIKSDKRVLIPFGKYKGQDLLTIAKHDKQYVDFLVKHRNISIENIVMS